MKTSIFCSGAALLLLSGLAFAQPDAANGGKADNPANLNMGGPGGGGFGGRGGGRNNMTAAQREQLMALTTQIRDLNQRQTLVQAGITDVKVQDAVIAFLKDKDAARQKLQQKWFLLVQSLRGQDVADTLIVTQLNSFRDAVDDEKTRREQALAALDTKIGYTKNPKLDAQLLIAGIIDDDATFLAGVTGGGGGNMMGGNGGPGGGGNGGGPGGGQGGFGGGPGGGPGGGGGGFGGGPGGGGGFGGGPGGGGPGGGGFGGPPGN